MTPMPGGVLTPSEMAAHYGVTIATVRRWADRGLVSTIRTPGGHRRYIVPSERP
jgi:DNA-binding transcriptional MerR regulator